MRLDHPEERVDAVRRKLLKASAVVGGSMILGHATYQKPAWKSFFGVRSAWAQPTAFTQHIVNGQLGVLAPGTPEDTGQDCYQFDSARQNNLTITATPDGNLDIELFLYGPGVTPGPGEPNLLTGNPFGLDQAGLGAVESAMISTPSTGTYTICIEDARTAGNQVAGLYTIQIDSTKPMSDITFIIDEGPESDGPSTP